MSEKSLKDQLTGMKVGIFSHAGPAFRGRIGTIIKVHRGMKLVTIEMDDCVITMPVRGIRNPDGPDFLKLRAIQSARKASPHNEERSNERSI